MDSTTDCDAIITSRVFGQDITNNHLKPNY